MPTPTYYKQNRLKQLRAFCFAAREGSISRAAEELCLSQPSVSLQIQALERELETTLFERRGPIIRLTPQGQALVEIALPLVEGIEALPENFRSELGDLNSGEISIAAGESTILYLLPEIIKKFADNYPAVRIKLHNVTGRDGLAMLRSNRVDFAVGSMLDMPDDIQYRPIVDFATVLIVPTDHPLASKRRGRIQLEEIGRYGLILPPRHLATWRMVEAVFQQHGVTYNVTLEAGGWEVIKKYVEVGIGISIVTDICLTGSEKLVRIPLDQFFAHRTYGVVLRRETHLLAPARKFIEMMAPTATGELRVAIRG
jgi:DNA-binding transcriptional LysR family regulator